LAGNSRGVAPRERQPPGYQFVNRQTKAVDVGPRVGVQALNHLRRQIRDRPENVAGLVRCECSRKRVRHAEVGNLRHAGLVHEDVLRLDIAVHHAPFVGVLQRCGHLHPVANRLCLGQTTLRLEELAQRVAVHVLHDQVMAPFVYARVVDANDVRMLKPSDEPRLPLQAGHEVSVSPARHTLTEDLDRDPAAKALVLGQPHIRHSTGAEQPFEAVSCVYDIGNVQGRVTLQRIAVAARSGERNTEFVLLAASAAFLVLAWRALDAAVAPLPGGSPRIVAQFLLSGLAAHLALRVVAPRSAAQPFAIAMLLSATGLAFVIRLAPGAAQDQANWTSLGVALMVATAALSGRYSRLRAYKYTAALAAVLLLVATGLFGTTINGARLWFTVAGQSVQSTELIKLFLVVFLAGYLADEAPVLSAPGLRLGGRSYSALPYLVPLALTLLIAIAALALLKDLGSIALLLLLTVGALYVATGRLRFVAGGVVLLALVGFFGYFAFDHARTRIEVWLDPQAHADSTGYQTLQATFAIQAGGVTGEGLGLGEPDLIPAAPTDYVFSAIAEELGLAGALAVVLLYLLLLFAGLRVAIAARDSYSRLLAACVALLIAIQAAVIIAGNLRIIPTTGITLPFVSYGGSSLIVNFALVGLLLGISDRSRRSG
jgi:cell division protein FtsW (lipid II flippase)